MAWVIASAVNASAFGRDCAGRFYTEQYIYV